MYTYCRVWNINITDYSEGGTRYSDSSNKWSFVISVDLFLEGGTGLFPIRGPLGPTPFKKKCGPLAAALKDCCSWHALKGKNFFALVFDYCLLISSFWMFFFQLRVTDEKTSHLCFGSDSNRGDTTEMVCSFYILQLISVRLPSIGLFINQ